MEEAGERRRWESLGENFGERIRPDLAMVKICMQIDSEILHPGPDQPNMPVFRFGLCNLEACSGDSDSHSHPAWAFQLGCSSSGAPSVGNK